MARVSNVAVAVAIGEAETGVEYSPRKGALCPRCGQKAKVVTTRPWDGPVRVRYHKCVNGRCLLAQLGVSIKSVQTDKGKAAAETAG